MRALLAVLIFAGASPAFADALPVDADGCNQAVPAAGAACSTHDGVKGTCQPQESVHSLPPTEGSTEPETRTVTHMVCVAAPGAAKGFQKPVAVAIALIAAAVAVGLFVKVRHKKPAGGAPVILVLAFASVFAARLAHADIAPRPDRPRPPPTQSEPPKPQPPANDSRTPACGAGMGIVVLGVGVFGAWRIAQLRPREAAL